MTTMMRMRVMVITTTTRRLLSSSSINFSFLPSPSFRFFSSFSSSFTPSQSSTRFFSSLVPLSSVCPSSSRSLFTTTPYVLRLSASSSSSSSSSSSFSSSLFSPLFFFSSFSSSSSFSAFSSSSSSSSSSPFSSCPSLLFSSLPSSTFLSPFYSFPSFCLLPSIISSSTKSEGQRRLNHNGSYSPRILNRKSSHTAEWIRRQITDVYVKNAQQANYRSRAAFKLQQLDDKFLFLRKNKVVVDLGCYPGGWSQVAIERCYPHSSKSRIIGVDKLRFDSLPYHSFIQGDVGTAETLSKILLELGEKKADVVLCDLSPPCTGIRQDDHLNSAELCVHAVELAEQLLNIGGYFITKMFMGSQTENFKVYLKSRFDFVKSAKPKASRAESCEMYFVCRGFIGHSKISEEVSVKGSFSSKEGYL